MEDRIEAIGCQRDGHVHPKDAVALRGLALLLLDGVLIGHEEAEQEVIRELAGVREGLELHRELVLGVEPAPVHREPSFGQNLSERIPHGLRTDDRVLSAVLGDLLQDGAVLLALAAVVRARGRVRQHGAEQIQFRGHSSSSLRHGPVSSRRKGRAA